MPEARLSSRAVIAVTGAEARPFLHGLLTQSVEALEPGELRYAALLTPQGRLMFDLFVLGKADAVWLDVAAHQREALIQRLNLHRLRAQVAFEPLELSVKAAWDTAALGRTPDPRLPALGARIYGEDCAADVGEDAYDALRFEFGVLDPARDDAGERLYATEANLDLLNGIDFQKGCFVGQETTSRMKRRGGIRSRVLPLAVEGAPPGAEVLAADLRAGEVIAARADRALALLRLDRARGAALTIEGRPVRLDLPPWLSAAVQDQRDSLNV